MRILRQLVYGSFFLLIGISTLPAADLKYGFMGTKWATNISELPDFVKVSEKYDVSYYQNPLKSYTLFDVKVPDVIYGFYADKFFAAYVEVETIELFSRLRRHISQKYGLARTTLKFEKGQTIYNWRYDDTKIKLKLYENEGKMKLGIYYIPLSKKVNQAQREAFPPARKPVFPLDERRLKEAIDVMGF